MCFGDIEDSDEVDSGCEEDKDVVDGLLIDAFPTLDDEKLNNADEGANRSARHSNPDIGLLFVDTEKLLFLRCERFFSFELLF